MDKVKIGIVGAKFAADIHCDSYARNDQAEVVAVADIADASGLIKKWNIPDYYKDYHEMFKRDDIDLISVCVPNFLHHDVAIEAVKAGKHVIVEKPFATTIEDAEEMVSISETNGVHLMYAEDWCFSPALRRAEEIVKEGGIGRVLFVKAKDMCGGGSFLHLGIHPIGWTRPAVDEFLNLGYVPELKHFTDCVMGKQKLFYGVNSRAGIAGVGLVRAFYESNEKGKTIYGEWC